MIRGKLSFLCMLLAFVFLVDSASTFSFSSISWSPSSAFQRKSHRTAATLQRVATREGEDKDDNKEIASSQRRRDLIIKTTTSTATALALLAGNQQTSWAAPLLFGSKKSSSLYVVAPQKNATDSLLQREPVDAEPYAISSELCLLKLLPVKNPLFRELEATIEGLSVLRGSETAAKSWREATRGIETAILELDKRRGTLEPVFNPEDSSLLQIKKAERGEQLIEAFRSRLVELQAATKSTNATRTFFKQKEALLALGEVGELLVTSYPYDVPTDGKFSYLPRLLGRAKVTFTMRRNNEILGNITIIADGYTAPITAGNFVDLSIRNFYTGLPIRFTKKRLGGGSTLAGGSSDFEVANIPILGSYQEGFYDPLTARPRRLPLELIRIEKGSGSPNLFYAQGLTSIARKLEPTSSSKPLLSFNIPGLVAMNHPDKNLNGASSEFFSLQGNSTQEDKRSLLDGEYAPFGYIVDGYNLFQELQPGDVIDGTFVDEWGQLKLFKLRRSSFSEMGQAEE